MPFGFTILHNAITGPQKMQELKNEFEKWRKCDPLPFSPPALSLIQVEIKRKPLGIWFSIISFRPKHFVHSPLKSATKDGEQNQSRCFVNFFFTSQPPAKFCIKEGLPRVANLLPHILCLPSSQFLRICMVHNLKRASVTKHAWRRCLRLLREEKKRSSRHTADTRTHSSHTGLRWPSTMAHAWGCVTPSYDEKKKKNWTRAWARIIRVPLHIITHQGRLSHCRD